MKKKISRHCQAICIHDIDYGGKQVLVFGEKSINNGHVSHQGML